MPPSENVNLPPPEPGRHAPATEPRRSGSSGGDASPAPGPRAFRAPTGVIAAAVLLPAIAFLALQVWPAAPGPVMAMPAHGMLEGMGAMLGMAAGTLAVRAYLKTGRVRNAALAGGLIGASILRAWDALATSPARAAGTVHDGSALVLIAVALLAFPVAALTPAPEARRRVLGATLGVSAGLALSAVAFGAWFTGPAAQETALDATAVKVALFGAGIILLAAAVARLLVQWRRDHAEVPLALPAGAALLAQSAAFVLVGSAWSPLWWLAHVTGVLALAVIGWGVLRLAMDAEQEVLEATAAKARSERLSALGTLVAGVAHEINNPLMFIRGNLELALADVGEADARMRAARAKDAPDLSETLQGLRDSLDGADRIARIVKSLEVVTRDGLTERNRVDLNDVAVAVANLAGMSVDGAVRVKAEPGSSPVVVHGDEAELHQVLLNLVQNAVDAIGAGPGNVVIRVAHRDKVAEVSVTDDGPGITEDARARVFTPFYTTKPHGTGLGLAIVHARVKAHDGDVLVDSQPGEGTTFTLRFPIPGGTAIEERLTEIF